MGRADLGCARSVIVDTDVAWQSMKNAWPPALLRELLTVLVGDAYRTSVGGSGKPNFV